MTTITRISQSAAETPGSRWERGGYYSADATTILEGGVTTDRLCLRPLWVPLKNRRIDRLGLNVALAAAGAVARIGIYAADGESGRPADLLFESPTPLDASVVAYVEEETAFEVPSGLVWIGAVFQGATGLRATMVAGYTSMLDIWPGAPSMSPTRVAYANSGHVVDGITGALPQVMPAALTATATVPRVVFRVA